MPAGIASCRNAAVLEKTSARSRLDVSSAASTCTGMSLVAVPVLPSLTVSLTVLVPAVVNVVDAVAPVASAVPLPSKSHEYVRVSPSASVAAALSATCSGAMPADGRRRRRGDHRAGVRGAAAARA